MYIVKEKRNIMVAILGILFAICLYFAAFFGQSVLPQTTYALGTTAAEWTLVDEQNYGSTLTDDTTVYHSGSESVRFVRKSLYNQATITYNTSIGVVAGNMYESIVWIKSKNADAATEFRLQLLGNDTNESVLRGITQVLNTSATVSPWTRVYTRVLIPEGITAVTPQIVVANGSAELWFDTVELNEIDVATVDQVTHFEQDSEGNFNGFVLRDGQYVRTLNQLTAGDGYALLTNAVNNPTQMVFYDVLGNEIERLNVNSNAYCFIAPSCYYAEVISSSLFSTYSLQKIYDADMIETSKYWSNNDFSTTISEAKSGVAFVYEGATSSGSYLFYNGASDNNVYFTTGKTYDLSVWVKVTTDDTTSRFTPYFKDQNGTAVYYDKIQKQNVNGTFTVTSGTAIAGGYDGWIKMTKTYQPSANFSPQFTFSLHQGSARVVVEDFCVSETNTSYQAQVNALLANNPVWEGDLNGAVSITNASTNATAGETYTFDVSFLPQSTATTDYLRVHIYSGTQRVSATDILLPNNETELSFTANQKVTKEGCSILLPDWLDTGTYTLRLGTPFAAEPIIQTVQITGTATKTIAKVENSTIYINDTAVSPMLYLGIDSYSSFESKPDKSFLKQSDTIETISQSGIQLYSTFSGNLASMWKEDGTVDYTRFDQDIYEMLCTSAQAKVMVNIGLYAPDWWLSANPNEQTVVYTNDSTSKQNGTVSFASTKFRTDAGAIVQQILSHMQAQPYYDAIFAIKLSAGGTNEWQYQGFGDTSVGDYSACALTAFREYCEKKYGEISALNTAWELSDGYNFLGNTYGKTSYDSFADVELPTYKEIYTNSNALNTKQKVIDWGLFVNETVVDTFLYFAKLVKTDVNDEKIVGGYGGYLWVHETAAIGFAGTSAERLYASPYIDFLSSPLTYHERYLGMSTTYMGLNDSLRAYGKIYLLEQDSRTALRTDYGNVWTIADHTATGQSFNMQDTLSQLKRDFAINLVNGAGFWMYDMESGWYDDASIYQLLQYSQTAYENAVTQSIDYTNEVAVIVDDEVYAYTARNSSYYGNQLYLNLYRFQRQSLALMGAGYDTYALSSLTAGKVPEHKVYIFLAPTTLDTAELAAIDGLKKDGNYLVFISMVGTDTSNMKSATGMTMSTTSSYAMQVEITNTAIADGKRYGAEKEGYKPISYVNDNTATQWGKIVGTNLNGLAYKDNSTWHCVYSTAPNLPTSALRYILAQAGVHIYSQDSGDIVHSNSKYLSLYSQNGGEKTLSLDGYYQINDAYTGALVSARTNSLQYTHRANDTRLFSLTRMGDYQITVTVNGETTADWYFEGDAITLSAPAVTGKRFVGWECNGEILSTDSSYTYTVGNTDQTITAKYETQQYTITWNVNGKESTETYHYGDTPSYKGNTDKASDNTYTYTFNGWSPTIAEVTKDKTYTAQYTQTYIDYTITWNVNGKESTETYHYGDTPSYKGNTDKTADNTYTYTFNGWSPTIAEVTEDKTYTAQYTQTYREYTITWNVNGKESTETYHYGETPSYKGNTDKDSDETYTYTFNGWSPTITAVTKDKTYTAQYTQTYIDYTITWIVDGEESTETYHYGATPSYKGNTDKTSDETYTYTFNGWSPEITTVKGNATYTAQYTATYREYTITWNVDGEESTETYHYGATPVYKGNTDKASDNTYTYAFNGWSPTIAAVTEDKTYTAQYTQTYIDYTITWIVGREESTETYHYGDTPSYKGETDKASDETYTYAFDGWSPTIAEVTEDKTYTAQYTQTYREYTITWNVNGKESTETYHYGETPSYKGNTDKDSDETYTYTFNGWSPAITTVTKDETYTAQYEATYREYTITWIVGREESTETYHYGATPVYKGNTDKASDNTYTYTFNGWSPAITAVKGNATYEATYTATYREYTITWIVDGEESTETYHYGDTPSYKGETDKDSDETYTYTFDGWSPEITAVTGNKKYTAQYTQEYIDYTITWIVDGAKSTETYHYGDTPSYKGNTEKTADETYTYTFNGWSPAITTVTKDEMYTAQYTQTYIDYTITWIVDGEESTETYHYGAMPSYKGNTDKASDKTYTYTFDGWSPAITAVKGNATYEATYTATYREYTIRFVDYDGREIVVKTYHYGDTVTPPDNPTLSADSTYQYTFDGWSPAITTVTGNKTYEATYTATYREYTIRFVDYDGREIVVETYHYGDTVTPPDNPTLSADSTYQYTFNGWSPAITAVTGDKTYEATYTATYREYTIRFVDYDGREIVVKTYHYGDTVTPPDNPTLSADSTYQYTFDGWSPAVTAVKGNATYEATYAAAYREYTITWIVDGAESTETYHYGDTPTYKGDTEKMADETYTYTFNGWSPTITAVKGNATYEATYTATYIDYTITWIVDGEESTETYHYGETPSYKGNTDKDSDDTYTYTFNGWSPTVTTVTGNKTYEATYAATRKTVQITWSYDGKTETEGILVGETVEPKSVEKEGYTFDGWYLEETPFDFTAPITQDITLTARFTLIVPDEPNTPDEPEVPDEPDTPDVPDVPDEPDTPDDSGTKVGYFVGIGCLGVAIIGAVVVILLKRKKSSS